MNERDPMQREIIAEVYRLAQDAVVGALNAEGAARLEQLVLRNAVARDAYASFIFDTVVLRDFAVNRSAGASAAAESNAPPLSAGAAIIPTNGEAVCDLLLGMDGGETLGGALGSANAAIFPRGFVLPLVVTLLLGAIGFGALYWAQLRQEQPALAREVDAESLMHGRVNAVWLDSGTTTLSLDKIGTIVVEGPADFKLIGPKRARLTKGRIRMRVTEEEGKGFVVETPHGNVTDLGTEFGIDVPEQGSTELVVFDGAVDLETGQAPNSAALGQVQRLVRGEGVTIDERGKLDRVMSVITGTSATFQAPRDAASEHKDCVIVDVSDNLRTEDTKKFYEIVPNGMDEDALAYVDRPHQWNGLTKVGMPAYLKNADYVKMFARDRTRTDLKMQVRLGRPAVFYVLFDERVDPPEWLTTDFEDTGDRIGMDLGIVDKRKYGAGRGVGPGADIDVQFKVWKRTVAEAAVISLGLPYKQPRKNPHIGGMYGIAARALEADASGGKSLAAANAGKRATNSD